MKRSELEKDAACTLDRLKQLDCKIPSNRQILKVIFYKLVIVYVSQLLSIVSDIFINSNVSEYHYLNTFVLSLGSNTLFSLAFLMLTYSPIGLKLPLGSEITKQSVLLKLVERKINSYSLFLPVVSVIAGCILLSSGERLVAGPGFSWFVTYLISMLTLQTSLFRYMTPVVVSSLSEVKELLPASPR